MGTPDFAVASLDILVRNNYNIVAVITAPDRLGGRGKKQVIESAVKKYSLIQGLKILQPEKFRDEKFLAELKSLEADIQIVVAFRMLPEIVWNMPKLGSFNLHGSLLPKYRGAAPINWAIINGEKTTGVTTFFLTHKIDTGNILMQNKVEISENDDAGTMHDKLMEVGASLVLKTLQAIEHNQIQPLPQVGDSCEAPKIFHETCKINWSTNIDQIYNFIRGLSPYPGAWAIINEQEVKIFKTKKHKCTIVNIKPGKSEIIPKTELRIYGKDGYLTIEELQFQGKKRVSISEYLNGLR